MRCRLLSTSPPSCLLFAGWLSFCILLCRLHLGSPFVVPPPHVSILYPPPSFTPAGCCVASHHAASPSHPLNNMAASQCATTSHCTSSSTLYLPLVCPNWLPRCLMWHIHLTYSSLPSPLPLPLVAFCSHPPWLIVLFRQRPVAAAGIFLLPLLVDCCLCPACQETSTRDTANKRSLELCASIMLLFLYGCSQWYVFVVFLISQVLGNWIA